MRSGLLAHVEAFGSDGADARARELLGNAPSPTRADVTACDGDSDPLDQDGVVLRLRGL